MISADQLRHQDRKTLARAITLLESTRPDHRQQAEQLLQGALPQSGNAIRIGITGVPGVGKSTLIEALGNHVIQRGHRVAVLAVDPSSSLSGGSIMGDKTRMETLATNEKAFIRPTPAGKSLGGIARRTRESIILCEAAGYDVVIVETLGVGQAETLVSEMTDVFLLMLLPGGGDELQGIKRGVMELADIVIVNKADDEFEQRATLAAADVQQALRFIPRRVQDWQVPVLKVSARDNRNIDELWDQLARFRETLESSGGLESRRREQLKSWLWSETREMLLARLHEGEPGKLAAILEEQVIAGKITPTQAARQLTAEITECGKKDS